MEVPAAGFCCRVMARVGSLEGGVFTRGRRVAGVVLKGCAVLVVVTAAVVGAIVVLAAGAVDAVGDVPAAGVVADGDVPAAGVVAVDDVPAAGLVVVGVKVATAGAAAPV